MTWISPVHPQTNSFLVKLHPICYVALGLGGAYVTLRIFSRPDDSADPFDEESLPLSLTRGISSGIDYVGAVVTGNQRLSSARKNIAGVVLDTSADLIFQAESILGRPVGSDAYTLARAVRSEGGSESEFSKCLRAHVLINLARQRGMTVTALGLLHTAPARNGHYGRQIGGAFSTSEDPYTSDLQVGEDALADSADPTGGSIQFSDRSAFGVQEGTSSWQNHVASRYAEGKKGATLAGARSGLVFWYKGFLPANAKEIT